MTGAQRDKCALSDCRARFESGSADDHCSIEGVCWSHCTDIARHMRCDDCGRIPAYESHAESVEH